MLPTPSLCSAQQCFFPPLPALVETPCRHAVAAQLRPRAPRRSYDRQGVGHSAGKRPLKSAGKDVAAWLDETSQTVSVYTMCVPLNMDTLLQ